MEDPMAAQKFLSEGNPASIDHRWPDDEQWLPAPRRRWLSPGFLSALLAISISVNLGLFYYSILYLGSDHKAIERSQLHCKRSFK